MKAWRLTVLAALAAIVSAPAMAQSIRELRREFDRATKLPGELVAREAQASSLGKQAWAAWLAHQTMLINENRLSPRDPKHRAFLEEELVKYLFSGGAEKPAGYVAPEAE